ncbi:hypothetical protein GMD94_15475 [Parabacteroides merdae]|uniref:Uncharacterized protein n=1 Tax=Parabacteroides merdae TaxID=46503 RepID=A0A3R5W6N7_9BACT|nr:hypothetical protein [Parabacteroides merdae]MTT07794.1 hypothetical protein [Parabacteroides merdae]MTT11661.1 hypothetical protein [Parabacteroides merdae]MTT29241.1 hypothetical protein [Parabacteroides merdae]MTT40777.1 hypothetical protein [Parabacteroides merdae]
MLFLPALPLRRQRV